MSAESIQENIKIEQRAIDSLKKEIQEAVDRDETERISNLEQQIQNHNDQIERMNSDLQKEQAEKIKQVEKEKEEAENKRGFLGI